MVKPLATLELNKAGQLGWVGFCGDHGRELKNGTWSGKRTSVLRGEQPDIDGTMYLVFRCPEKGGHLFNVLKPKNAPGTAEAVAALRARLIKARAFGVPVKSLT